MRFDPRRQHRSRGVARSEWPWGDVYANVAPMTTNINKALRWIVFGNEENPLPKSEQRLLILIGVIVTFIMTVSFYR